MFSRPPLAVDQLGLVQPVDGLGQGVVVAVATAAHQMLYARFCKPFGVPDGDVLRSSVGAMDQLVRQLWPTPTERLFQRIRNEFSVHRLTDPPGHDAPGIYVDDEGHEQPVLPGTDVGDVRHPQFVRPLGFEVAVDPVQRTRR